MSGAKDVTPTRWPDEPAITSYPANGAGEVVSRDGQVSRRGKGKKPTEDEKFEGMIDANDDVSVIVYCDLS